jgi:hypothetical protein
MSSCFFDGLGSKYSPHIAMLMPVVTGSGASLSSRDQVHFEESYLISYRQLSILSTRLKQLLHQHHHTHLKLCSNR